MNIGNLAYWRRLERDQKEWAQSLPARHKTITIWLWISIAFSVIEFIIIMILLVK